MCQDTRQCDVCKVVYIRNCTLQVWNCSHFSSSRPCRYLSHFRSVHRGAYFAELRTTTVRKLLPESWGFLCPVHTPDGSPCGLLNHFTAACRIVTEPSESADDTRTAVAQVRAPSCGQASCRPDSVKFVKPCLRINGCVVDQGSA